MLTRTATFLPKIDQEGNFVNLLKAMLKMFSVVIFRKGVLEENKNIKIPIRSFYCHNGVH